MNILIVDDEPISADSLASMLDWDALGISDVMKAYSMKQAQQIFEKCPIDILISDIEMPCGSGIELMEWVRAKDYKTLCIFLTSFSKFEYASRAVKLQIFEYLLKPVEYNQLQETLTRALKKLQEEQVQQIRQLQGEYWQDNRKTILQHFWRNVISGKTPSTSSAIIQTLEKEHISTEIMSHSYWILLLRSIPDVEAAQWPTDLWSFAINNILEETFPGGQVIGEPRQDTWILQDTGECSREEIQSRSQTAINALSMALPAEFLVFCSNPCRIEETHSICSSLQRKADLCLSVNGLFLWMDRPYLVAQIPEFSAERWNNALLSNDTELILEDIDSYFASTKGCIIRRDILETLYHQLLNCVYHCLEFYRIPLNTVFQNQPDSYNIQQIMNSVTSFKVWAEVILNTVSMKLSLSQSLCTSPVINAVCKYIRKNLNEDLSRTVLAEQIPMNPDYLSTLFRQEMECSLVEYITVERIKAAKQLLLSTTLPVSEIAIRTGFQNISYFTKQFKRLANQTPFQYRKLKPKNNTNKT